MLNQLIAPDFIVREKNYLLRFSFSTPKKAIKLIPIVSHKSVNDF